MSRAKVAVSLEQATLGRLDQLVRNAVFPSRSQAIQVAIEEKLERIERSRLARECAKLDRGFEKALAEEGMSEDLSGWPEY
jgi:metal-responsive CopG/Arc/MetJ family transcriptional regulator